LLRIAITGNIAAGKSQVEKILSEDFPVYDTDIMAHEILDTITDFYGYDVFENGKINRKKLGKLVFSNPNLKEKLEHLIHPKIREKILNIYERHSNDSFVFVSVPLLFESGFNDLFDKVLLVTANENIRLERLKSRNNLSVEEAKQRINAQMPQESKLSKADYIISNNSTFEDLEKQVSQFIKKIKGIP